MKKIRTKKKKEDCARELKCFSHVVRSVTNEAVYVSPNRCSIEEVLRSSSPSSHVYEEIPEEKLDPTITELWSKSSTRTSECTSIDEASKGKSDSEKVGYLDLGSTRNVTER